MLRISAPVMDVLAFKIFLLYISIDYPKSHVSLLLSYPSFALMGSGSKLNHSNGKLRSVKPKLIGFIVRNW